MFQFVLFCAECRNKQKQKQRGRVRSMVEKVCVPPVMVLIYDRLMNEWFPVFDYVQLGVAYCVRLAVFSFFLSFFFFFFFWIR